MLRYLVRLGAKIKMKSTITPLTIAALVGYGFCYSAVGTLEVILGIGILYGVVIWVLNFRGG